MNRIDKTQARSQAESDPAAQAGNAGPAERLRELMLAESALAADDGEARRARLLRHLAETTQQMTPAERTWLEHASEEELRRFAHALRAGCADEQG